MSFVIKVLSFADGTPSPAGGMLLRSFDPEKFNGRGFLITTIYPAEALRFATAAEAFVFWRQSPKCKPLDERGKANRPMCAYSVEFFDIDARDGGMGESGVHHVFN